MHQQRRYEPQSQAHTRPRKHQQPTRRSSVIKVCVQRQQPTTEKTHQRQTQKEEHSLQVSLPPVTQNHHHPEKRQQCSSRQIHESEIEKCAHVSLAASLFPQRKQGKYQVQENSCIPMPLIIVGLPSKAPEGICACPTQIVRKTLDCMRFLAILAVGCKEC